MTEIGSRLLAAILLAGVCACGPSQPKTPGGATAAEEGFHGAGGAGASADEAIEPADHDIEVPPAP